MNRSIAMLRAQDVTALSIAVQRGYNQISRRIVAEGADVNMIYRICELRPVSDNLISVL